MRKGHEVLVSKIPKCDLCKADGVDKDAEYDGVTIFGSWANMCSDCFSRWGMGTGTGRGQKLILKEKQT